MLSGLLRHGGQVEIPPRRLKFKVPSLGEIAPPLSTLVLVGRVPGFDDDGRSRVSRGKEARAGKEGRRVRSRRGETKFSGQTGEAKEGTARARGPLADD